MSDKTQYKNTVHVSGLSVIEASPIDDRMYVLSENILRNSLNTPMTPESVNFLNVLHDGMVIQVKENRKEYVWAESDYGLMNVGYTYPPYATSISGQNYANKTYNFVLYDKIAKVTTTYTTSNDPGLVIPADLLPIHIVRDMASAELSIRSSTTTFKEINLPDRVEFYPSNITIIFEPKPAVGEVFKVTIY